MHDEVEARSAVPTFLVDDVGATTRWDAAVSELAAMEQQQDHDESTTVGAHGRARHLFGHGRLSYIQIPAVDVRESAAFYARVFGWVARGGGDNHLSFTDATGDMIGAWVTGRTISQEPGVLPYIYVHGIDAILERVKASGGDIVNEPYPEGDLWVATCRDPAGNTIGIWQQGPRSV